MSLHVWHNGYDWVIAESIAGARKVCEEAHGSWDPSEYDGDGWVQLADDRTVRIVSDENNDECGCRARFEAAREAREGPAMRLRELIAPMVATRVDYLVPTPRLDSKRWLRNGHHEDCPVGSTTKTCAEWVAAEGRGFLCSTEY